ncbi:MAG: hypothetical protein ACYDB3_09300 [Acidimicrobiales bacterium]
MSNETDDQIGPKQREQLLRRLDRMIESGQVSEAEAAKLRAAAEPGQFDTAVRSIRVRHAGTKLKAAVEGGHMTQDEADGHLEDLKRGKHSRALRAQLNKLFPRP